MLMCAVIGLLTLVWLAATSLGLISSPYGARPVLVIAGVVASFTALVAIVALTTVLRRTGGPLAQVMEAADRVAAGDYEVRVAEQGPRPVRALARSFNTMTERLQNADRLRRNLMADVAHELRTPVTVLQGRLEGLIDGVYRRDDEQMSELLEETRLLSRLIDDLRTLAQSDAGALRLEREPTNLVALVHDVVRATQTDAAATSATLNLTTSGESAEVDLDPLRIREVLTNLLSNALRYAGADGAVTVSVKSVANEVAVAVADTGVGMLPDEVARMFDRFYKGPESRGSGLGLAIAKGIVTAHGGRIWASSERGQGTTVTFTLPRSHNGPTARQS
jgi:signal transduction histidine kinase